MRIAICTPHTGMIRAKCAKAVNELVAHTLSVRVRYNGEIVQPTFAFFYEEAGTLDYKRARLALNALAWGADYHLLIDWDIIPPPDGFLRLAAHDKPFVAANYMQRHGVLEPAAIRAQDIRASGRGLEAVAAVGLGFALVKPEVFAATPKPWFRSEIDEDGNVRFGEDVHFCNQVRHAGIPVVVDHDLAVGHIAETVLTLERAVDGDTDRAGPEAR